MGPVPPSPGGSCSLLPETQAVMSWHWQLGFVGAAAQTQCKGLADPSACSSMSPASVAQQVTYPCGHFFIPKDKDTTSKSARGQMLEPQKNGSYSVGPFR